MKYQKGDTLIEVTLAIGIFSMIAIAIVAVMNSGTSGSQSALETTLAREEIDAQAEALRFIHSSYIADKDIVLAEKNRYLKLWREITDLAVEPTTEITKYLPKSCEEAYGSDQPAFEKAFVINTRYLSDFSSIETFNENNIKNSSNGDSVLFTKEAACVASEDLDNSCLTQASTYPRLIYKSNSGDDNLIDSVSSARSKQLYRAEGVYIVAVKDSEKGTSIISDETTADKKSAFYDFYIRTCWYSAGTNTPSTISTVIRLYDPDAF